MADQLQIRGGDTASNATFTGAQRELSIDTSKNQLIVHDGATPGGHPIPNSNNPEFTGDAELGGDLTVSGSATFASDVLVGAGASTYVNLQNDGFVSVKAPSGSTSPAFGVTRVDDPGYTAEINADGSCTFKGAVNADTSAINSFAFVGTNSSAPTTFGTIYARNNGAAGSPCYQAADSNGEVKARINNDGTATFVSVNGASVLIQTEAYDETKYDVTTEEYEETIRVPVVGGVGAADLVDGKPEQFEEKTVTRTREVRTYNGVVLDVMSELQSLRTRATKQDETIALMTEALREMGADVSQFSCNK